MKDTEAPASRWFVACSAVTLMSAGVSAGFSIAAAFFTDQTNVLAWYALSRSLALLLAALYVVLRRWTHGLVALGLAMTVLQLIDFGIGLHLHVASKTYGPLGFAILTGVAVVYLLRAERAEG